MSRMGALAVRGVDSYRQTEIESRSPLELVVMLYDGALRFTADARDAMLRRDIRGRQQNLSRALAIVSELQSTLNMDTGGEVAEHLDNLYGFVRDRLLEASATQALAPLDEARRVLATLREGWLAISRASAAAAASALPR
jgi:flagellar protein FliS